MNVLDDYKPTTLKVKKKGDKGAIEEHLINPSNMDMIYMNTITNSSKVIAIETVNKTEEASNLEKQIPKLKLNIIK